MNVDFVTAIKLFFANYVNFKGRSTRAEYWFVVLFCMLVSIAANIIDSIIHLKLVASLAALVLFLPQLALLVRRFHDTGRSGKLIAAIYAIAIIGGFLLGIGVGFSMTWLIVLAGIVLAVVCIYMLVVTLLPSAPDNQYGPNPYAYESKQ